jgi:6-bladed beta-propeller
MLDGVDSMLLDRTGVVVVVAITSFVITSPAQSQIAIVDDPSATVGLVAGAEFALLVDASLGAHGEIYALDGRAATVLSFDRRGRLLGTIGRAGRGPGEFADPFSIDVVDNRVWILDSTNRRASAFSPDGALLDELAMRTPFVVGEVNRFADGSWVLRRQPLYDQALGLHRDTVDYYLLDSQMGSPQRIARVPGALGGAYTVADGSVRHGLAAFTPEALSDIHGRCLYITSTDRPEVRVYTADNEAVGVFPFTGSRAPRSVTAAHKRAFVEWIASNPPPGVAEPDEATKRAMLKVRRFAAELPTTMSIIVDPSGFVWLQDFGIGEKSAAATVLAPALDEELRVDLPGEMRLLDVGQDYLLAQVEGPYGEDILETYALNRGSVPGEPPPQCTQ